VSSACDEKRFRSDEACCFLVSLWCSLFGKVLFVSACLLALLSARYPSCEWIGLDWIAGSGVYCACEVKRYVESWKFDICMVEVLPC
jgi:hypothetical protein